MNNLDKWGFNLQIVLKNPSLCQILDLNSCCIEAACTFLSERGWLCIYWSWSNLKPYFIFLKTQNMFMTRTEHWVSTVNTFAWYRYLVWSKTMNRRVHCSYSVLKGLSLSSRINNHFKYLWLLVPASFTFAQVTFRKVCKIHSQKKIK